MLHGNPLSKHLVEVVVGSSSKEALAKFPWEKLPCKHNEPKSKQNDDIFPLAYAFWDRSVIRLKRSCSLAYDELGNRNIF